MSDEGIEKLNQYPFASYKINLYITSGINSYQYVTQYRSSVYDRYNRILEINCLEMIEYEKEQCLSFYDLISESNDF